MLAGLLIPGRPVGNMYFAAWSHNVIANAVNLSNDLKLGEYRACYFPVPSVDLCANPSTQSRFLPVSCSLLKSMALHWAVLSITPS